MILNQAPVDWGITRQHAQAIGFGKSLIYFSNGPKELFFILWCALKDDASKDCFLYDGCNNNENTDSGDLSREIRAWERRARPIQSEF